MQAAPGESVSGSYDVVIAGAGIAGLSLAALLARREDCSVLIVEKSEEAGGRFSVEERDGYLVDFGVHACLFGSRGAIGTVLSRCENRPSIVPAGAAIYDGERVCPFLGDNLFSLARQRVVSAGDLVRLGVDAIRSRGESSYETSVTGWARKRGPSPSLERVLQSLSVALLPTDRFESASAGELFAFLRQAMRRLVAMGYPRGGWGAVIKTLVATVERSSKCKLVFGAELERILAPGKRVDHVVISGREVGARAVVCAFPPQQLAREDFIQPALRREYVEYLGSLLESSGLFVDIGLSSPVTEDDRLIMVLEPPALLWAVSNISPEVAPPGRQLLQLFSPLSNGERFNASLIEERTRQLVELAERVFKDSLREQWRRAIASTVVGVAPYTTQSRHLRPDITVPGFRGVFLAGDGVNAPGLGGDLAARSALKAERLVYGYLKRRG